MKKSVSQELRFLPHFPTSNSREKEIFYVEANSETP